MSSANNTAAKLLTLYGSAHFLVDALCAALIFNIATSQSLATSDYLGLLLLFHVLAFGLQSMFGLAVDLMGTPRAAAAIGCAICSAALFLPSLPATAMILAGLGNAIFHVGGGVVSLRINPGRATAPGIYVAPGSLGLLLGAILGRYGLAVSVPLVPITLLVGVLILVVPIKNVYPKSERTSPGPRVRHGELIVGLILLSISVRALMGLSVVFPWETHPGSLIVLTFATAFGKVIGGILADRWGWIRVAVGALILALPLLASGSTHLAIVIPGVMLPNFTMPVTLVAVSRALPGFPGFAFGLTCLALLFGALPPMLGYSAGGPGPVALVILTSAAVLYFGLRVLKTCDIRLDNPAEVQS